MARREVDHHRRFVVGDGDEIAAVRDLVGPDLDAHRRGLDRRASGVISGGIETEDRHVADIATRRQPGWDHLGATDDAACGEHGQAGHARGLEGSTTVKLVQRDVGAAVGNEHDVLHREGS